MWFLKRQQFWLREMQTFGSYFTTKIFQFFFHLLPLFFNLLLFSFSIIYILHVKYWACFRFLSNFINNFCLLLEKRYNFSQLSRDSLFIHFEHFIIFKAIQISLKKTTPLLCFTLNISEWFVIYPILSFFIIFFFYSSF